MCRVDLSVLSFSTSGEKPPSLPLEAEGHVEHVLYSSALSYTLSTRVRLNKQETEALPSEL